MKSYNGFSPAQRTRAQAWLNAQWRSGTLQRPTRCVACGQDQGIIHAHAEDYSEPFGAQTDEFHLCYVCHMMVHCRFGAGVAWNGYRAMVRQGYRTTPSFTADFGRIKRALGGGTFNWTGPHAIPLRPLLDAIGEPPVAGEGAMLLSETQEGTGRD